MLELRKLLSDYFRMVLWGFLCCCSEHLYIVVIYNTQYSLCIVLRALIVIIASIFLGLIDNYTIFS